MLSWITEPELRRTLFYDCGLYCRRCGRKPVAQVHAEHEYSVPLIKAAGIGAVAIVSVSALAMCVHWIKA